VSTPVDPKALRERALKILQLDYFAALAVPRAASAADVAKAYVDAAKVFHPDRAPSEELRELFTKVFTRLDLAKTTLEDPERRARYLAEITKPAKTEDRTAAEALLEFKKADAMMKKNSLLEAERHLRRAVHLAPKNVEYASLLVWVQAKPDTPVTRLGELAKELDGLLQREPDYERAIFYRAQIRKRLGRDAAAMTDFGRALELNPSNIEAARELRIHNMRKVDKAPEPSEGGFFKRLFKR